MPPFFFFSQSTGRCRGGLPIRATWSTVRTAQSSTLWLTGTSCSTSLLLISAGMYMLHFGWARKREQICQGCVIRKLKLSHLQCAYKSTDKDPGLWLLQLVIRLMIHSKWGSQRGWPVHGWEAVRNNCTGNICHLCTSMFLTAEYFLPLDGSFFLLKLSVDRTKLVSSYFVIPEKRHWVCFYFLRSIHLAYVKDVEVKGIQAYRFAPPSDVLMSPKDNPTNEGFCVPAGDCLGTGVLKVSVCREGKGMPRFPPQLLQTLTHFLFVGSKLSPVT